MKTERDTITSRLTFNENQHSYWLADDAGKKRRIPSVSALKKTLHVFSSDTWTVGQVADASIDDWDTIVALPPVLRRDRIIRAGLERLAEARDFGKAVHSYAETLWTGEPVEVPEPYRGHVTGLAEWWQSSRVTLHTAENMCWAEADDDYGAGPVAGRFDLIVQHPAWGLGLLDIKTWRTGSAGATYPAEWCFQLAAYAGMDHIVQDGVDAPFPPIKWLGVLHCGPGGTRLYKATSGDWDRAHQQVMAARVLKALPKPNLGEVA